MQIAGDRSIDCNNLGNILHDIASRFPDQCAISIGNSSIGNSRFGASETGTTEHSFAAVKRAVVQLAEKLRQRGLDRSDRIALLVSNGSAFPVAYFASLWIGAVVVPLNPLLSGPEIKALIGDCRPRLLIAEEKLAARLEDEKVDDLAPDILKLESDPIVDGTVEYDAVVDQPVDTAQHDTAVILYTSGTTGTPKGVELTHRNLYLNAKSVSQEKFSTQKQINVLGPGEVGLASLPLSHAFGLTNFQNGVWFAGGCIVFQDRFNAEETIRLFLEHQVTFFAGVPTMYVELIREGKKFDRASNKLKYCVCGGAALSKTIKEEFRSMFGVVIQESYGLSETSPMISCQKIDRALVAGCVGSPIDGVEIRLADENGSSVPAGEKGEILVRGHNVFRGYFRKKSETNNAFIDGWFRTGDLGVQENGGELRIVDRLKEIIISGGYTIYPREIETVLLKMESVEQAVVVGVPDDKYGEIVKALVSLSSNQGQPHAGKSNSMEERVLAEISSVCKKNLASFKRPRIVEIVNQFPTGSTGKIDRKRLKEVETLVRD